MNEANHRQMYNTLTLYNADTENPCFAFHEPGEDIIYFKNTQKQEAVFSSAWSVEDLLHNVALSRVSCLIDCGALVTGMSSLEVSKYFMSLKLSDFRDFYERFDAFIFWDESDAPFAFQRNNSSPLPLAMCSVEQSKWFVYFDHIHTTGTDIKLPRSTVGLVTLSSGTVLRDYVQACWRLRQLGHGQKVRVLLVPEIVRLVVNAVFRSDSGDDSGGVFQQSDTDEYSPFHRTATDELFQKNPTISPSHVWDFLKKQQDISDRRHKLMLLSSELKSVWRKRFVQDFLDSDCNISENATFSRDAHKFFIHNVKSADSTPEFNDQELILMAKIRLEHGKYENCDVHVLDQVCVQEQQREQESRQEREQEQEQEEHQEREFEVQRSLLKQHRQVWNIGDLIELVRKPSCIFHPFSARHEFPGSQMFPDYIHCSLNIYAGSVFCPLGDIEVECLSLGANVYASPVTPDSKKVVGLAVRGQWYTITETKMIDGIRWAKLHSNNVTELNQKNATKEAGGFVQHETLEYCRIITETPTTESEYDGVVNAADALRGSEAADSLTRAISWVQPKTNCIRRDSVDLHKMKPVEFCEGWCRVFDRDYNLVPIQGTRELTTEKFSGLSSKNSKGANLFQDVKAIAEVKENDKHVAVFLSLEETEGLSRVLSDNPKFKSNIQLRWINFQGIGQEIVTGSDGWDTSSLHASRITHSHMQVGLVLAMLFNCQWHFDYVHCACMAKIFSETLKVDDVRKYVFESLARFAAERRVRYAPTSSTMLLAVTCPSVYRSNNVQRFCNASEFLLLFEILNVQLDESGQMTVNHAAASKCAKLTQDDVTEIQRLVKDAVILVQIC
jgi:hypothetical protein